MQVREILHKIGVMKNHYEMLNNVYNKVDKDPEVAKYVRENLGLYKTDLAQIADALQTDMYKLENRLYETEINFDM